MNLKLSDGWQHLVGWSFILLMVATATLRHDAEIILPEIGALTAGTWVYRKNEWVQQPLKLFLVPSGTAIIGFLVNQLSWTYTLKVMVGLLLMLLLLKGLKSNLAPAFATGLLPIIINATHWSFIVAILFWTLCLMTGAWMQRPEQLRKVTVTAVNYWQMLGFISLVFVWVGLVWLAGQPQMAAIPPVIVVFFEAAQQPEYSATMAIKQWLALSAAASVGVGIHLLFASWLLTTVIALPLVYLWLRMLNLKLPAAYAFPLLALVLPANMFDKLPRSAGLAAAFFLGTLLIYRQILSWVRTTATES
ncbi:hypothetical protein [Lactiplantibacillus paraplantarum]|uniref:hypothetical protein n=1 Tax=Lactiplantibacillus paraplantarum TaxID=60520 RepID=UPI0023AAD481|nr:hypothetical protein [Lactiplantibacillus paraplantarum]WEE35649.1 hypothetical protein PWO93_13265 [Lactiplantibacillus paraplantarum]